MGERRGSSAGGGRGDMKAVGRHARSGGNKVRGSGGVMMVDIVDKCERLRGGRKVISRKAQVANAG